MIGTRAARIVAGVFAIWAFAAVSLAAKPNIVLFPVDDDVTLPRQLQQAGYTTIHVGKAHFAPDKSEGEDPLNLGFDVNVAGTCIGAPGLVLRKEQRKKKESENH